MPTDLAEFLRRRQAPLTAAFESGNIPDMLKFYHPDLSFSDHAWHATNLSFDGFKTFLESTYTTSAKLTLETHGVHGTAKEMSVWDWTLRVVASADDPIRGLVAGREIVLRGCSLHWWRRVDGGGEAEEDEQWKIVREEDFACPVPTPGEAPKGHQS